MKTTSTQLLSFHGISRNRIKLSVFLFLLTATTLMAQKPIDSLSFATDQRVFAAEIYQNYLYIGGDFNYVGKKTGTAAFFFDGSSLPDYDMPVFGEINPSGEEDYNDVKIVIPDDRGGWFVGGSFKKINNREHLYLAHILPDKQVDGSFVIPFSGNFTYGNVSVLKRDGNYLYVGGLFGFSADGNSYKNVFRVDLRTLKIDPSWNPPLGNSDHVDQIEISEDRIILAGAIGTVDGIPRGNLVVFDKHTGECLLFPTTLLNTVHLHLMGDTLLLGKLYLPQFPPGFGYLSAGISLFDNDFELTTDSVLSGKLYACITDGAGGFYASGEYRHKTGIFHLDQDLRPVSGFSQTKLKKFDFMGADISLGNNSLYVTSAEYYQGTSLTVDGKTIKALFKLNAATGKIDTTFRPNPNGKVFATLLKGDTLFVAGSFNTIGGVARTGLAAVNANTGKVYDWDPSFNDADGFYLGFGRHHVSDLALLHDTLYAAGLFLTNKGSVKNISSLVRFNMANGSLDSSFYLSRNDTDIPDFESLLVSGNKVYVVGKYELTHDGTTTKNVGILNPVTKQLQPLNADLEFKKLDNQAFDAQGKAKIKEDNGILYITGYLVTKLSTKEERYFMVSLDASTLDFTQKDMAPSSVVYAMAFNGDKHLISGPFYYVKWYPYNLMGVNLKTMAYVHFPAIFDIQHGLSMVHSDKYLYIGSGFEKFGDSTVHSLVRLKRKDLSITHFDHKINNNTPFFIHKMVLGAKGLYVAGFYNSLSNNSGAFTSVDNHPRQNICLIDPEDASLKSWNPPAYNSGMCNVFAYNNTVILSGAFNLMPAWSRSGLAKIDLNTGKIADWNPKLGEYYATVYSILISNDTVFVGGDEITKVNNEDAGNLIAIHANTETLLKGFAPPDMDGAVFLLYKKGNHLYAGGNFKNINSVSHNHIARFNSTNGSIDAWNPQLDGSWNMSVNDIFVQDSLVFIAGGGLGISGNTGNNIMMRVGAKTAALKKLYPGTNYAAIGSIAVNDRGDLVAGMLSNNSDDPDFYMLDKTNDTLVPVNGVPQFSYGIHKIRSLGNYFLVAGNHMKEKGKISKKPGLFVYDPVEDTVTTSFSTPVLDGDISTIAANDQVLVFAGNFGGMNENKYNGDIAFMQTPDLQLQPGITSWSPKTANNVDLFAVSIYGSGFTQNASVRLALGNTVQQADSIKITSRKITAFFSGTDFTVGKWDLNVNIGVGNSVLYPEAIDIKKGEKAAVWIDWSAPDEVLTNKPENCYLTFGNRGSSAALGVFLYLGVGPNQMVELPKSITHLEMPFEVNWDTISQFVNVDYFLGEPYHGKVYTIFIPYLPANYEYTYHLKITTTGSESADNVIKYAISKPLFGSIDELTFHNKSTQGTIYNFFRCAYDVVGIVADLTPGVGCVKSFFDNTVVAGMDKYMNHESVSGYDVVNSVGMIALGCVPGGAEMGKAYKVSKEMVEMGTGASGAFSSCKKLMDDADKDSKDMKSRFSHDPNAKYGPSGQATSRFVHTGQPFQYMITYENDSAATAAAQRVIITDTLDKSVFDLTSFKPIGFGFGDTTYFYKNTDGNTVDIDLRPDKDIIVRVRYDLSQDAGILTWTFLTIDPNTYELTDDVYAGFLPPNKKAPEGEGNVLYSISPLSGLADGRAINNSAHIVFDWNEAIPTDQWHNVTDNTLPESAVNSLPAVSLDKSFTVNWGGSDPSSGIYSYSIYVAENDNAYYLWLPDTKDTSAVFSGEAGNTYKFYSIATDSAGNKETTPAIYDAITQISGTGIDNFGESRKMELRIYPNPATNRATIGYSLPESGSLRIDLLNGCGYLVKTVFDGNRARGKNSVQVDLSPLPAGFYFVRVQTKQGVQTRKLIVR